MRLVSVFVRESNDAKRARNYDTFMVRFLAMSDVQLIDAFNREVGNDGWVSARAAYLAALQDEFQRRDYDYSAIDDETRLSLRCKLQLQGRTIGPLDGRAASVLRVLSR